MQGFVDNNDDYVLYVRLAAGSDSIPAASVSWQLFCTAGYEDSQTAHAFQGDGVCSSHWLVERCQESMTGFD